MLTLGDLAGDTDEIVREYIVSNFEIDSSELEGVEILVASDFQEAWEGSNWFLIRKDDKLYEIYGSHCSCYGFEGQWNPEDTTVEYLKSDKFNQWQLSKTDKELVKKEIEGL